MGKKILIMACGIFLPLAGAIAVECGGHQFAYGNGESAGCIDAKFTIKTTEFVGGETFKFQMSAQGTFYVDWGDGVVEQIVRNSSNSMNEYSHTYDAPGVYNIRYGGEATRYSTNATYQAINFRGNQYVAGISGSLGAIFSTIDEGDSTAKQPRFRYLFQNNTNLEGPIPEELFWGIKGQPVSWQFANVFEGCSSLTGEIPRKMFMDIQGVPAIGMFSHLFEGCSKLIGEIPPELFAGINGDATTFMYAETFRYCSGLTGKIPDTLFGFITGAPKQAMYRQTFQGCSGLTGEIPDHLFGFFNGAPAGEMFVATFDGCTGLKGYIPQGLFEGVSPSGASAGMFNNMFKDTGLATTCPCNTGQHITEFEEFFDGRVSCVYIGGQQVSVDGICVDPCSFGYTRLKTNTGLEFPLVSEKVTPHSIVLDLIVGKCYVPLRLGNGGLGSLNLQYKNQTWHAITID